jgi:hypothetical protein
MTNLIQTLKKHNNEKNQLFIYKKHMFDKDIERIKKIIGNNVLLIDLNDIFLQKWSLG